jgi:hypothetical protein
MASLVEESVKETRAAGGKKLTAYHVYVLAASSVDAPSQGGFFSLLWTVLDWRGLD